MLPGVGDRNGGEHGVGSTRPSFLAALYLDLGQSFGTGMPSTPR